jgi:hypothetical protein
MTDEQVVHVADRLSAEAPLREAELIVMTEGYQPGDTFVIHRRISWMPGLRWDACEMEVLPGITHMTRAGFGTTRRAALRRMLKEAPFRLAGHPLLRPAGGESDA